MARQTINIGAVANDRTGDPLRIAFTKTNANFIELYQNDTTINERIDNLDISDLSDNQNLLGSSQDSANTTSFPFLELTNNAFLIEPISLGEEIAFEKIDYDESNTAIDFIDDGVALTRANQNYLYNPLQEESVDRDVSPIGTLWNRNGWGNLSNFRDREYVTFDEAFDGNLTEITDYEIIMHDTVNNKYYTFKFSSWTQGQNGGGFAYTRQEIIDPNFFQKSDYGSEIDVFVEDDGDGSGIGITRGNNQGIFNPYREGGWNSSESPAGTLWNRDGWTNLADIETRTYQNFYDIFDGNLGNKIPQTELIMYIPEIEKYYAIKFISWTQGNAGGGFSYLRYELDLAQLQEGILFADGTRQKTAYVKTGILSKAPNRRLILEKDGFFRANLTEKVFGDTLPTTIATTQTNTTTIAINETPEILAVYNSTSFFDLQFSFDEVTWVDGRNTGFSSIPVRRYFISGYEGTFNVTEGQTIYIRTRSGGEPVRWFRDSDDDFRGAILDFHVYSQISGTIVGTIYIIRDAGDYQIEHTEVKSGDQVGLSNVDLWFRPSNESEREIWVRRFDGVADTISFHWHGKFFYGREYWD